MNKKRCALAVFSCALLSLSIISFQMKPKSIVFFGDSITEQGAESGGYITMLTEEVDPGRYALTGAGIGGNKVYDLYLRLEKDVLKKDPDLVFIYVGINDVWHKNTSHTGTDYPKFIGFYQALIDKIKASGSEIVLCTPTVIGEKKNGQNPLDKELDKYAEGIRILARKNQVPVCDLRKEFQSYLKEHNPQNLEKGVLTTDRVHLTKTGNQLVAEAMLPFIKD